MPLGPQQTVIWSRGMSTSTPLRLCCRAPRTLMDVASSGAASCVRSERAGGAGDVAEHLRSIGRCVR